MGLIVAVKRHDTMGVQRKQEFLVKDLSPNEELHDWKTRMMIVAGAASVLNWMFDISYEWFAIGDSLILIVLSQSSFMPIIVLVATLIAIVVNSSTILSWIVGLVVTSFIIAFILNWRIMFVVLTTYPLIISGHVSETLFMQGFGGNLRKSYLKANILAREVYGPVLMQKELAGFKSIIESSMILIVATLAIGIFY